jgi:hypothetical protein
VTDGETSNEYREIQTPEVEMQVKLSSSTARRSFTLRKGAWRTVQSERETTLIQFRVSGARAVVKNRITDAMEV